MAKPRNQRKPTNEIQQSQKSRHLQKPPSWAVVRDIFTCKNLQQPTEKTAKKCKKMKCSGSLCNNTKVIHRPEASSSSSSAPEEFQRKRASLSCSSSSNNGVVIISSTNSSLSESSNSSFRGLPFRRFSGCYECRMVVDPFLGFSKDPSLRGSFCSCPECGEIFMKAENLELHQALMHAVSELGPEDTSKNIVEIIFQSSWLKKQTPICKIDRILKVHNSQRTIAKFEEYRDSIKAKATAKFPKKHPRCVADGNELLRFHCTTFTCSLGLNGSSNLCNSIPQCSVCSIIKNGFKVSQESSKGLHGNGILTTATSGKAHDEANEEDVEENGSVRRAMMVCRVIAGRVKKIMESNLEEEEEEDYDSMAGAMGLYSNLDELYVFNPKAILPCFVVIYSGF